MFEKEVGTPLFDRIGKRIRLNKYGEIFLRYSDEILTLLDRIPMEIEAEQIREQNSVLLIMEAASMLLPELYDQILSSAREIRLSILQNCPHREPQNNQLILSASWEPPCKEENSSLILLKEKIRLAVPAGHPLAGKKNISLDAIRRETFLSLSPERPLSKILEHYYFIYGFRPESITYMDDPKVLTRLLSSDLSVSFLPASTWEPMDQSFVLRDVEGLSMYQYLLLSWRPDLPLTPAARRCRQKICDFFTRYNSPGPESEAWSEY
ncbi:MAG TPA: hypothetical protein IAB31_00065 [Candidatus Choladousia intestinavium]|uniref:HTH lysR-type domain-containing protein n=1 Tax=Candidatus Choladousia intestinavium TaxID=2840727 RepID=A0A9D1A932_9FIRM|nr:hypothetical protein [Candidatus Choladousia intestinavium]